MAEKNTPTRNSPLTRRQFAGALAAGLAAPALLGSASAQEEKPPQARAQGQGEEETWLERGRRALREHPVPADTEPAFVFSARVGAGHGE